MKIKISVHLLIIIVALLLCIIPVVGSSSGETPWIRIDAIADKFVGSTFTITGTTNLPAGSWLNIGVSSSAFRSAGGTAGTTQVRTGGAWSYTVDARNFHSDEYIVTVESTAANYARATTTFNVLEGAPVTMPPAAQKTATPTTAFSITSSPSGAGVWINDQYRGATPLTIQIPPGTGYRVRLDRTGYETWSSVYTAQSGRTTLIHASLVPVSQIGYNNTSVTGSSSMDQFNQSGVGSLVPFQNEGFMYLAVFLVGIVFLTGVVIIRRRTSKGSDYVDTVVKRHNSKVLSESATIDRDPFHSSKSSSGTAPRIPLGPEGVQGQRSTSPQSTSDGTANLQFPVALQNRYNPIAYIGEGGFARVYKAMRRADSVVVAVKIPRIDEKTSSIFIKEVAAWYHLTHPNIVKLNGSDLLPIPHLEMEYIDGIEVNGGRSRDLDGLTKPLQPNQVVKIIYDISRGLQYAHGKGIYHHDLKPLNILITSDLVVKIADFGLSKISSRSSMTTNKGYSPLYAAPEQLDSEHYGNPDQRTDLYHLGLIFYELLTNRLPYDGSSHVVIISKILSPEIAPATLASVNPDLAVYDPIIGKLTAKRMEDRFQDVSEFHHSLQIFLSLNKERKELLDDLKLTKDSLRKSTGKEDIRRLTQEAIRKSVRIALLHAQLNDRVELITALNEIRLLTSHHKEDLDAVIDQLQYMIAEDLPPGSDWIDQLRILLGKIEMQG